ncbi:nitrate reductase molybdenum cofactor assembly chaperone [Streptomyces sp. NBC_01808]|uniref:nitrate reductase molybdenum cofactor assembly chaperone n=1 Tax=Streptomyces sp. NBC_01808 TaxID=2975947 RepID=UPI002DDBCE92|nr:nitrate reductase molybdenum cofactor assembly chaperone [Streptomyces sp. NBC_01808]WSA42267.1 nitrate reductase molybdenum cofactor assembly chaperone [Streptomyces sp. NBC_01808]
MTAAARPALLHQAASLLLLHPGDDWPERRRLVRTALTGAPGRPAGLLRRCCDALAPVPVLTLSDRYVTTFDRSRRRTLHLTYYTDGDTRRRGGSLLRWQRLYRAHGWQPPADELPDFLPLALEFAARCPTPGRQALQDHRAALELLRLALTDHGSPYADVLDAVCRTLPGASPADRAAALRLARSGPPAESVGLLPFPARLPGQPGAPSGPGPSDHPVRPEETAR